MNTSTELLHITGEELKNRPSVYESGERSSYSVFNEVVETSYSRLVGILTDLIRYEESKNVPNANLINYYNEICSALWLEKSYYGKFTDSEIINISKIISPLIKSLILVSEDRQQIIIREHKGYFEHLLQRWK